MHSGRWDTYSSVEGRVSHYIVSPTLWRFIPIAINIDIFRRFVYARMLAFIAELRFTYIEPRLATQLLCHYHDIERLVSRILTSQQQLQAFVGLCDNDSSDQQLGCDC